jgi:hypothetical protein
MLDFALVLQQQPDPVMIQRLVMTMMAIIPILILFAIALFMVPCWFILKKAGLSPWLSLLCVIPTLGTLVLLYVTAFSEWRVTPLPQQAYYPPQPPFPPQPPVA